MIQRSYRQFGIPMLLCLTAGCASIATIDKPAVQLSGIKATELSFTGQTFLLSFDVSNPNPFPLPIQSVRYHVQLEDQSFASGETASSFSVPANGSGDFDISVELDVLKSASSLSALIRSGMREPVDYELRGSLAVGIPLIQPLPFSTSGTINIGAR